MAINFPSSPATNDTFTGPTGLEYIFDGVKWRSFKPSEPVVGTFNANSAISLSAGGTNQNIVLTPSGTGVVTTPANVGIGTSSPVDKLSVYSSGTSIISVKGDSGVAFIAERASNDATNPGLNFRKYRGTIAAPLTIATGDVLGGSNFLGYDGSALISAASIRGTAETVTGTGDISGALTFLTRPAGTGTSTTERMRITSAGNVGIGNTAPTHNLSVNGTTYMSGNVGIGTISPAAKLDVIGIARIQAASGGGILNILPDAATFTSEVRLHTNSGGSTYQILRNASGVMTVGTLDSNPMSFRTNNTERMFISSTGDIGIGVTPAVKLHVAGGVRLGNLFGLSWNDGTAYITADTTAPSLSLSCNNNAAFSIDGSGNAYVGNQVAAAQFTVSGAGQTVSALTDAGVKTGSIQIHSTTNTAGSGGALIFSALSAAVGGTTNQWAIKMLSTDATGRGIGNLVISGRATTSDNALTERVRITPTGFMGVGNNAPTRALDVAGPSATFGITNTTAGTGGTMSIDAPSNSMAQIDVAGATYLRINTNGTERTRIDSTGNMYVESGNFWQYTPNPTALAAGANAITAAGLQGQIFTVAAAVTTAVTFTLPLATALDTLFAQVPTTNIGFDFYIINAGVTSAAVTVAVNTGITLGAGSLTVAIGTSAKFRLRRTAANTYLLYRMG